MSKDFYCLLRKSNYAETGLINASDSLSDILKSVKKSWLTRYNCKIADTKYLFFDNGNSPLYKGQIISFYYDSNSESYKNITLN